MQFQATRITHQYTQTNCAPPETVFPLLCPVREADWVPGWQYRLIYSQSGLAELSCVFITEENHRETTWVVTEYNLKALRIAFVWVDAGMVTAQINIELTPETTTAPVSQANEKLTLAPESAAERRQNKAHGASRGYQALNHQAPEGRKTLPPLQTSAHIRYTYTALSPEGNRELERYNDAWFRHKMQSWEAAINHYLRTGKRIAAATWE